MRVNGRYELLARIGTGSSGIVYGARDVLLHRFVAVKLLHDAPEVTPERREELLRQMRAITAIEHPNIAAVFEVGEYLHAPYIAMEILNGTDLAQQIKQGCELPLSEKLDIMAQICDGLQFAHARGAVHGRLKPGKIFLQDSRVPRILDLAGSRWPISSQALALPVHAEADYMAPEVILGAPCDVQADLFSAGVVFFEFLVGKHPFAANFIPRRIAEEPADRLRDHDSAFPPDLEGVLDRALTKRRRERFQSAADFAAALREIQPAYAFQEHIPSAAMAAIAETPSSTDTIPQTHPPSQQPTPPRMPGFPELIRSLETRSRQQLLALSTVQRWAALAAFAGMGVIVAGVAVHQTPVAPTKRPATASVATPIESSDDTPDVAWNKLLQTYPQNDVTGARLVELKGELEVLKIRFPSLRVRADLELAKRSLAAAQHSHENVETRAENEQLDIARSSLNDLPPKLGAEEIAERDALDQELSAALPTTVISTHVANKPQPADDPTADEHRVQALLKRIDSLYEEGKYSEGLNAVSQLSQLDPGNPEAQRQRERFRSAMEFEAQFASPQSARQ